MKQLACASHNACITVIAKFQFRRDSDMLFNSQTYIASY